MYNQTLGLSIYDKYSSYYYIDKEYTYSNLQ